MGTVIDESAPEVQHVLELLLKHGPQSRADLDIRQSACATGHDFALLLHRMVNLGLIFKKDDLYHAIGVPASVVAQAEDDEDDEDDDEVLDETPEAPGVPSLRAELAQANPVTLRPPLKIEAQMGTLAPGSVRAAVAYAMFAKACTTPITTRGLLGCFAKPVTANQVSQALHSLRQAGYVLDAPHVAKRSYLWNIDKFHYPFASFAFNCAEWLKPEVVALELPVAERKPVVEVPEPTPLIRAKIVLYRELHIASTRGPGYPEPSGLETHLFATLASDPHVQMKLDGHFPDL